MSQETPQKSQNNSAESVLPGGKAAPPPPPPQEEKRPPLEFKSLPEPVLQQANLSNTNQEDFLASESKLAPSAQPIEKKNLKAQWNSLCRSFYIQYSSPDEWALLFHELHTLCLPILINPPLPSAEEPFPHSAAANALPSIRALQ